MEAVLAVGVLDVSLEQAIVVPALPAVAERYAVSPATAVWVVTALLLAAAVAAPLAGRLGDQYGRRRVLEWSLGAFVVGSLASALADSIGVLIAGRILQGLGAGVGPLAFALVRDHVEPARVPRAIGLIVGASGVGAVLGLLCGALLVDHVSIASMFWVLFATAAALLVAVRRAVPESLTRSSVPVDWAGAALLAGSLAAVTLAITQGNDWGFGSVRVLALAGVFAVLLAGFVARERTASAPLLEPSGLARRPIWSAQLAVFAVGLALSVAYALLPFLAALPESTGYGLGLDATEIGLVLVPSALAVLVGGPLGGRLVAKIGARPQVVGGLLCLAATYALFVALPPSAALIALAMIPLGFGTGLAIGAIVDLVALSSDPVETGAALGLTGVIRAVGGALGAQVGIAIVTGAETLAPGVPSEAGFERAFAASLAASLLAVAVVAAIPRRSQDPIIATLRPADS